MHTPSRRGVANITPEVKKPLQASSVPTGFALLNAMHITPSVFINHHEPRLHQDHKPWLAQLVRHEPVSRS